MRDQFHNWRRASINDRVRTAYAVSTFPYQRRQPTTIEREIAAAAESRGETLSQVFWSIAIAAEPIRVRTVIAMLVGARNAALVRSIEYQIEWLTDAGFIECSGGPDMYVVCRRWWRDLLAFGGHYDDATGLDHAANQAREEEEARQEGSGSRGGTVAIESFD